MRWAWQDEFEESLEGLSEKGLTAMIDHCYHQANRCGKGRNTVFSLGAESERIIWKKKAALAMRAREKLK